MNSRQRVKNAVGFISPDKAPLQYYYTPVGYYEHGQKLNDLYRSVPGDFEPHSDKEIPVLSNDVFDCSGKYHEFKKDDWGTVWEYRIYGIAGIPYEYPLLNIEDVKTYMPPVSLDTGSEQFKAEKEKADLHKQNYYLSRHAGSILERMIALCPDETIYCELAYDSTEVNMLADMITDHMKKRIFYLLALDVDGISFGDDYGSESNMLLSPDLWRRFFKPRWKNLFKPIIKAEKNIHFHSCGYVLPILEDLREIGINSIWPQLPAYDMNEFAKYCRDLNLAVVIHSDRANTMTFGTPAQVADLVKREYETFRMHEGGSWFYVEADNGFPFDNIKALVETIALYR